MDQDSPSRTFWTVWYYITGAVNRFFRPELTNLSSNDTNSIQETSVDSEPANFSPAEGDASGRAVDEEQPLATALLLSSSQPVVAWELCTTDIDLGGDEESMQYKTQLSSQRKASEKSEGKREEQCPQVGNDDAGLLVAEEDKHEENRDTKLSAGGRDEKQEEVENQDSVRELACKKENNSDEGPKQLENELLVCEELSDNDRDFQGDPDFTSLHVESQMAYDKTGIESEDESFVVEQEHVLAHRSESDNVEDANEEEEEEEEEAGAGIEEQCPQVGKDDAGLLVAKEDKLEENRDERFSTGGRDERPNNGAYEEHANTRSLKLPGDAISEDMEESGRKAGAEEETERATAPEDPQKVDKTMRNIQVKEAESKTQHEDEIDLQAKNSKVKLCPITDLRVEEEDSVHVEEAKLQRDQADSTVTHEEVENCGGLPVLACKKENCSDVAATQLENELSVCEELSGNDRAFKRDPDFISLHVELQMAHEKTGIESEYELFEQEHVSHRSESDNGMDAKEKQEAGVVVEDENVNEDTNKQTIDEAPEQEDAIKTVAEESQEEDILTERVTHSEEVVQNTKPQLHTAELPNAEQVDVAMDADVQTKTREVDDDKTESLSMVINDDSDVPTTNMSVDEGLLDYDQIEDERLFSEVGIEERVMEIAGTMTSVAVKPEGETGQEMSGEFKNIPPRICEGQVVVLQELNFPTCEETQEGVPEYNNVPVSDENTTQRFLKEGDCEEIQGSKLPEEVESKEPESPQNSGCRTGADYLLETEYMEDNSFDAGLRGETEKPLVEAVTQETGRLFEEEEGELLVDLGIEHSKEFESDIGLTDQIRMVAKEMQNGSEEILVEYEVDEGLCDSKVADAVGGGSETTGALTAEETFLKAEGQKMTETSFFQESVDATSSEQNSNRTLSLLEDITESVFLKPYDETEPKLLEDVAIQVLGIDVEETGDEVEVAAEDETQSKHEMEMLHLQVVGLAESELSRPVGSLETRNQRSDEELEISDEVLTDSEAADISKTTESKPKDFTMILREVAKPAAESEGSCGEEMVCSFSGSRDVIDEEILDLWLQTALSEYTEVKQQVEPPPGQQLEPYNEWQGDISSVQTEKDKELLVESNSRESELVSDTEMLSSTVESGFLDQSLSEWGTQNSETPLLITTSTGSVQGIYDTLAIVSESADLSKLSTQQPNSESQDILMEEVTETGQSYLKEEDSIAETGFHPDSGVPSPEPEHLNQESNISPKEEVESVETETRSQEEIDAEVSNWKDTEERDSKSLTEISSLFKVKETKAEDEPLEMTVSDSPDEIKRTESEESDVAGQPTTESEDQKEVDSSALDFTAQKSRISVKNPRVRPPKDPRSLLHMPSLDPTPSPHLSAKLPAGMPLGGLGFGVKLPGLGAGFPVLKKTQRVVRDDNSPDTLSQETKPEERSDTQDEAQHKPKWMPPRHPGFGNPLMSELKTKLKKTTKE